MKVIAIDFDGTLCFSNYPKCGKPNMPLIREAKRRQAAGDKLILWTCREGETLDEALRWCRNFGLHFDAVNENLPEMMRQHGTDPRKVGYDELWDDKAVPTIPVLQEQECKERKNNDYYRKQFLR